MKKVIKILGLLLGVMVVLGLLGFVIINSSGIPNYPVEAPEYHAKATPEALARGEKLVSMLCAGCHLNKESGNLVGHQMMDAPPEFGTIYSANITADPTYGIGKWTDGEILYLLRTGIKRDGRYAPPYMAKLPTMADEDINAIIAFLRSGHPLVAADATPDKMTEPSFLTKLLCRVAFKPFPMPDAPIPAPDSSNTVALGKYLAHNLDCFSCHSADFKTNDFLDPTKSAGYFAGGNKPLNLKGQVVLTPNLTPDEETGIGSWSKEQFVRALKYGIVGGDQPALQYPMAPYSLLTDHEAGAIYEYLMTIPPIKNKVERSVY
ncbi:MAG: c-type cytochrome [Saprospiraceae bacterium]|nr:c-type cytochrome [Saprospiraceae bacterium]